MKFIFLLWYADLAPGWSFRLLPLRLEKVTGELTDIVKAHEVFNALKLKRTGIFKWVDLDLGQVHFERKTSILIIT